MLLRCLVGCMILFALGALFGCSSTMPITKAREIARDAADHNIAVSALGVDAAVEELCHHARVAALSSRFRTYEQRAALNTLCRVTQIAPLEMPN